MDGWMADRSIDRDKHVCGLVVNTLAAQTLFKTGGFITKNSGKFLTKSSQFLALCGISSAEEIHLAKSHDPFS